jgi:hypothetical protein
VNAALEMRHGGPDVASGELDLVSGRARMRDVTTVWVLTIPQRETRRPPGTARTGGCSLDRRAFAKAFVCAV